MKGWSIFACIMLVLMFIFSQCGSGKVETDPVKLWDYFTKVKNYKTFKSWPDHQGIHTGAAPHGPKHIVYINDVISDYISKTDTPNLPDGSLIVKENLSDDEKLLAYTVMYKSKGYNPSANDWYWVKYKLDGTAEVEGKLEPCIKCHAEKNKNADYIMNHTFK